MVALFELAVQYELSELCSLVAHRLLNDEGKVRERLLVLKRHRDK